MPDRIQLQLHAEIADRLGRLDECAPHIVIADQRLTERDAGFRRIAERCRDTRVGHRNDDIGIDRVFPGEQPAHHLARLLHRSAEDDRIRPRKIHMLEHALRELRFGSIALAVNPVRDRQSPSRRAPHRSNRRRRSDRKRTFPTRTHRRCDRRTIPVVPSRAGGNRADHELQ